MTARGEQYLRHVHAAPGSITTPQGVTQAPLSFDLPPPAAERTAAGADTRAPFISPSP